MVEEDRAVEIQSDTFTPKGEHIGFGTWGKVSVYNDLAGDEWAIKDFDPDSTGRKQMKERGWTEEQVMRNEGVPLDAACHHTVPRLIERDKTGRMYVAMPVFREGDLEKQMWRERTLLEKLRIVLDIADSLKYTHERYRLGDLAAPQHRAHGDVRPANILMKSGRAFLTDWGSQTCISMGSENGKERGEFGNENYRAPEKLDGETGPSARADIWSLGALAYELIAESGGIYDGIEKVRELSENQLRRAINKKLRRVPARVRKTLRFFLEPNEYKRCSCGGEAFRSLERTMSDLSTWKALRRDLTRIGLPLCAAAAAIYGMAISYIHHEPKELGMPATHLRGLLIKPGELGEGADIEFEAEHIPDLPKIARGDLFNSQAGIAKRVTKNRTVAYLLKAHGQAMMDRGGLRADSYTDHQFGIYAQNRPHGAGIGGEPYGIWPIWARSVEWAMPKARISDKKVDLEDTMAFSRLGVEKVLHAKRVSGSQHYRTYRKAKDDAGRPIIPPRERHFIDTWLAYYHADV